MLTEQQVRQTIEHHLAGYDRRINELLYAGGDRTLIEKLEYAQMALINLKHDLRLCDCPDEIYSRKARG